MTIELRYYQQRGADEIRSAYRDGAKAPLFVGPTGMGKTVLFSYICSGAASKGRRICIIAHRQELLDQISKALSGFNVAHGLIAPQYTPDYRKSVQVASVQALLTRLKKYTLKFDMLIIDEAHHVLMTNTWGKVYEALGKPLLLGVTATPCRGDNKGLGVSVGGAFDRLIEVITVRELINEGFLSDYVVYAPPNSIDLSGVKIRMGDYDKTALADRVDKPMITGDAVSHYARICPGKPAVVFGVSLEHCHHIAEKFQGAGFNFQVVDGSMADRDRKQRIRGLGNGIHGLVSCDLISEGTDIPAISVAIDLRPKQSLGLYIQQVGRALRPVYAPGYDLSTREGRLAAIVAGPKPRAILLDHVGNTMRLGLIDQERDWSLEGVKKRKRKKGEEEPTIPIKQCPKCWTVHVPAPTCPFCGHVYEKAGRGNVEQVDGELQMITPAQAEMMRRSKRIEVAQARTLEELQRIAEQRGYKPTWARMVFESRRKRAA